MGTFARENMATDGRNYVVVYEYPHGVLDRFTRYRGDAEDAVAEILDRHFGENVIEASGYSGCLEMLNEDTGFHLAVRLVLTLVAEHYAVDSEGSNYIHFDKALYNHKGYVNCALCNSLTKSGWINEDTDESLCEGCVEVSIPTPDEVTPEQFDALLADMTTEHAHNLFKRLNQIDHMHPETIREVCPALWAMLGKE